MKDWPLLPALAIGGRERPQTRRVRHYKASRRRKKKNWSLKGRDKRTKGRRQGRELFVRTQSGESIKR